MGEIIKVLEDAKRKVDDISMDLYLLDNPEGDNEEMIKVCRDVKSRLNVIIDEIQ